MSNIGGGDDIKNLPINKDKISKPGDLEIIHSIFQTQNIPAMKQAISPFKSAFIGMILFGVLSLPFIIKLGDTLLKNPIYSRLGLMVVFFIVFFILTKVVK